jgi:hypothetical protein
MAFKTSITKISVYYDVCKCSENGQGNSVTNKTSMLIPALGNSIDWIV